VSQPLENKKRPTRGYKVFTSHKSAREIDISGEREGEESTTSRRQVPAGWPGLD